MKKFLVSFLAGFILLVSQSTGVFAFYSDVPQTNPYYNSIKTLYELGRLPVEQDNKIHPNDALNKGELYKLILTYGMADLSQDINLPYSDIAKDSKYAPYIQTAMDDKLIRAPTEKTAFGLKTKITKYNALITMFNSLGIGNSYFFIKSDFPFTDITPDSEIAPLAMKAAELKILDQSTPEKFLKNKKITKGEAIDYLYKIKQSNNPTLTVTFKNIDEKNTSNDFTNNKNFNTLLDVWSTLKNKFLYKDKLSDDQLVYAAIKGMVSEAKDKYTVFDAPSESVNLISKLSGSYEGIGIVIELIEKNITIVAPFHDSPAEKAGLQGQDVITKIDGQSVSGLSLEEVSAKIKGPAKSTVKITITRAGQEKEFSVTRDSIIIKRVDTKVLSNTNGKTIDYISLADFGDGSDEEFTKKTKDLIKNNPAGIIVDLRNNPGGYVDAAINIISLFTDQVKTAVKMEFVDKHVEETKTNGNGLLKNYKIVVLINEGSASASEIVAGALKDFGIATIVGKKTFGKGVAQELRTYKDGSIFKYTISNWLTPNGNSINGQGISPDVAIEKGTDANIDAQLNTALSQF
ncbi:S41 family peptidase [Candidatus Peregrinibacteria bacterium]|nr:S41 family peptidase [Candidatus Peregrinibacteria bacterium]